jgi:hypothetical protein
VPLESWSPEHRFSPWLAAAGSLPVLFIWDRGALEVLTAASVGAMCAGRRSAVNAPPPSFAAAATRHHRTRVRGGVVVVVVVVVGRGRAHCLDVLRRLWCGTLPNMTTPPWCGALPNTTTSATECGHSAHRSSSVVWRIA